MSDQIYTKAHWLAEEEITLEEATLLLLGKNPKQHVFRAFGDPWDPPDGYMATKRDLTAAICNGDLDSHHRTRSSHADPKFDDDIYTIKLAALEAWATASCNPTKFFNAPIGSSPEDPAACLDPQHPRYTPKLAAAILAWLSVDAIEGKTVKKVLKAWLTEHAQEFDLLNAQGNVNKTGIDDIAKVANWRPIGGAPRTPN